MVETVENSHGMDSQWFWNEHDDDDEIILVLRTTKTFPLVMKEKRGEKKPVVVWQSFRERESADKYHRLLSLYWIK